MHLRSHSHRIQGESGPHPAFEREIRQLLHEWRRHLSGGFELKDPIDPALDHLRGDAGAAVQIVEYGCLGSIGESRDDRVLRRRIRGWLDDGQICLAFRHFPMVDSHPAAWVTARAVAAAGLQGRFWDLHDALTDLQASPWARELEARTIRTVARQVKLDPIRLWADMESPLIAAKILRDLHGGIRSGVNGAPTFYVQGIRQDIDGPDELTRRIEAALSGDRAALWPPVHGEPASRNPLARVH